MSRFYGFYYLATRIAQHDDTTHSASDKREVPEGNTGLLVMIVAIPLVIAATLLLIFTV